jgi:hypothetical protein
LLGTALKICWVNHPPAIQKRVTEQINDLVKSGVLKEGDSAYMSPVFFVLKKQNEGASASCGRLVYDYRKLNEIVKPMHYPLTKIDNLFEKCAKYKLFSLIDIKNAFLSVALTEEQNSDQRL